MWSHRSAHACRVLRRILRNISGRNARKILVSPIGDRPLIKRHMRKNSQVRSSQRLGIALRWFESEWIKIERPVTVTDNQFDTSFALFINQQRPRLRLHTVLVGFRSIDYERDDLLWEGSRLPGTSLSRFAICASGNLSWCDDFTSADLSAPTKSLSWRILSRPSRAPRRRLPR